MAKIRTTRKRRPIVERAARDFLFVGSKLLHDFRALGPEWNATAEHILSDPVSRAKHELKHLEGQARSWKELVVDDEEELVRQMQAGVRDCRQAISGGEAAEAAAGSMAIAYAAFFELVLGRLQNAAREAGRAIERQIEREPRRTGGEKSGAARRAARKAEAKKIEERVALLHADALRNGRSTRGLLRRACKERADARLGSGASKQEISRAIRADEALFRRSRDDKS